MLKSLLHHARILRLTVLIPIFFALLPLSAEAAKWLDIGSRHGAKIQIDSSSLVRVTDDKFRIWHRETYEKPQILDSGAFSFTNLTVLSEFECIKRLAAPLRRIHIASNGKELKSEKLSGKDMVSFTPDSITEAVFNYACKKRLAPKPVEEEAPPPPPPPPPVVMENTKTSRKKHKKGEEEAPPPPPPPAHWAYEGKTGSEKWGKLSADYATCGLGHRQSPIDIRETIGADLTPIRFTYKPVPLSIIDNGHTIQVAIQNGGGISVEGEDYELIQFHFHKPSEDLINGKVHDMVVHLVHKSKDGKLAVVAIMLQAGKEQQLIRTLWSNLPLEQHKLISKDEIRIDPTQLIPATRGYFTYIGSLTTPPCSEGVLWLVLKTPTQVSKEQIASFGKIYKNNARPVQPRNSRIIKESR